MTLPEWILDLRARLDQLHTITNESASTSYDMAEVILGLLFSPGAYLTATRQSIAHASKVSLENLQLKLLINDGRAGLDKGKFGLRGLKLQGAEWDAESQKVKLNDGGVTNLGLTGLVWEERKETKEEREVGEGKVWISVYLNEDRSQALFSTLLDVAEGLGETSVAQRAVALRAS